MDSSLNILKTLTRFKPVKCDTFAFKLLYKLSTPIFGICFLGVSFSQLFGSPIKCVGGKEEEIATSYCWNGYLHIIVNPSDRESTNNPQPHTLTGTKSNHVIRWLTIYRWVPILLVFHSIVFYLSHAIWKFQEGGLIKRLICKDMKSSTRAEWIERRSAIVRLIGSGLGTHKGYAQWFCLLEASNLCLVISNIFLMDYCLGSWHYGLYATTILHYSNVYHFEEVMFPITSKCQFPIRGPSGNMGTGKTQFAKAVASFSNTLCKTTFFNASASKLMSRWQSESEKALLELFRRAENEENSVIFFDEVDELLSSKNQSDSETSSRMKSIFLTCTDGIAGGLKNTIIIAATNRPWTIENSAYSRFSKKYHITLPNQASRFAILKKEIRDLPSVVADGDLEIISAKTPGFCGRDLKNLVVSAWMMNLQVELSDDTKSVPPLTMDFLMSSLRKTKPSIREEDKLAMEEFLVQEFNSMHEGTHGRSRPAFF